MSRRRGLAAFGLGATAGTAATLMVTGLLGSTPGVLETVDRLTRPPAAAAGELPAFGDCEELRRWYVDAALPLVGPWGFGGGWGGPVIVEDSLRSAVVPAPAGQATTTTGEAVGSSATGTNVQEAGVDEPDLAKTDGELLVRVRDHRLEVYDVSGEQADPRGWVDLPGRDLTTEEVLLVGDTALVVGERAGYYGWDLPVDTVGRAFPPYGAGSEVTHLTAVDVSDPDDPRPVSTQRLDGGLVAAREYGDGTVRMVLSTGLPPLDFVQPNRDRSPRQALAENRQIVRRTTIEDWLPAVRDGVGRGKRAIVDCTQVRHPREESGFGTISVLTFAAAEPEDFEATAVTAAGDLVYSSGDRLYVATMASPWWPVPVPLRGDPGDRVTPGRALPTTQVHAFALDGLGTTYLASGEVPGTVRDRWSFDEHDGYLRVATGLGRQSAVSVLTEAGDRLRKVGYVAGLGPDEDIQSVRWFDELAVVVTFRQVDPLYTVDLTDPTDPEVLGKLKVPGFSSYLHPVGGDRLLGVGQDATLAGRTKGAQVSLFDLTDLRDVRRLDTLGFGPTTDSPVGWDPRAFGYLPEERLALLPLTSWGRGGSAVVAVRVGADSLTEVRRWPLDGYEAGIRTLPLGEGRVALVDRGVRILDLP